MKPYKQRAKQRHFNTKSRIVGGKPRKRKYLKQCAARARLAKNKVLPEGAPTSGVPDAAMEISTSSAADDSLADPPTANEETSRSSASASIDKDTSISNPMDVVGPKLPSPRSKHRRGYHPPRSPRRPHRYATRCASKTKGKTSSSAHEKPMATQTAQVLQITSALQLPSQSKSTCRQSRGNVTARTCCNKFPMTEAKLIQQRKPRN